ncbi:acyltransferase family protein [Nakamurella antarctica]|uniref:acyltransferase family protein n=1 Tax=Nakamurella antarctica TaxID=1902245 RepID=UPI0013DD8EDF|nr:acyltransferase family protein [Nakamurella antarctica]
MGVPISIRPPARAPRGYAPALDGVRAVGVLAVILYHAGVSWLPGGFLGVDVFFVMSGYLVTALMQRERDRTGRIRFTQFWIRRARRLVPALALMLVVVCAAAVALENDLNAGLRRQVLGAATYSSNWIQIGAGESYVDRSSPALFTHLWSLAVEEQFYLIWPLVVAGLLGLLHRRRPRVAVVLALGLASAIAMAVLFRSGQDPTRVYAGTDTHGISLMLGAGLALARQTSLVDPIRLAGRLKITPGQWLLGPVCLAVLLGAMLTLTDTSAVTYQGGLAVAALAATGLVAVAARGVGPLNSLLKVPPMRWLGTRSYSLYLWHWPLLVIADRVLPYQWPRAVSATIAICVSVLLTEFSWRVVEDPIRRFGFVGYCRRIRTQLFGGGHTPRSKQRLAWGISAVMGVAALTAACGVVIAPTKTSLELQIEEGEAAVAHAKLATISRVPSPLPAPGFGVSEPVGPRTEQTPGPSPTLDPPTEGQRGVGQPSPAPTSALPPFQPQSPPSAVEPASSEPASSEPASSEPASSNAAPATPEPAPASAPELAVAPVEPPQTVTGDQVTAIGDSVMLGSAPQLLAALPGIDVDAIVSRQIWELAPLLVARNADGTLRPYVVIGLGTNGGASAGAISAALEQAGPDRIVVLVNTFEDREWQDEVNASLAEAVAARPHTCLADWHSVIDSHRGLLGPDGVHPKEAGRQMYADLVASAVSSCR